MGFTGDRGSLTVAAEWVKEDGVWASDRPYSEFPRSSLHPTDGWTTVGAIGGFQPRYSQRALFPQAAYPAPTASNPDPAGSRLVLRDGGNPRNPADYIRQNTNSGTCTGATATTGCTPGSTLHKSNPNDQMHLFTPRQSKSIFVDGIVNLTDDVRFRTNLMFNNRETERSIAGYPFQAAAFNTPLSANSYFNPAGTEINTWWRRTWEVPRYATSTSDNYRFSGAFEGSFDWGDRYYDWDVSYLHNESRINSRDRGDLHIARTQLAVGPSFLNAQGQVQCGTAANPISTATCVPWNPLLHYGVTGPGGLTGNSALIDFLFPEYHDTGKTSTTVMAANLTGSLFTLPAGDLSFALGLESRKEKGEFVPDALKVTGGSSGLAAGPTKGDYSVDEAYLEVHVPILADLPFARELSFDVATRLSDYDSFGETTNNKFGLKWKPLESLLVRATMADGFRAPTIADLYGGGSQTFAFYTDPCDTVYGSAASNATTRANCATALGANAGTFRQLGQGFTPVGGPNAQTPVPFTTGSNPTLLPELSESETVGVVWSPSFLEGFNLSVDWWNIRIESTIVGDSANAILNDCYVQGIASRCSSQLFTRDPISGIVNFMRIGGRNAGFREVEGFDVDWTYRFDLGDWGKFQLTQNTTYTSKDVGVSTNDPRVPLSSVSFGNTHRIRSNANLNWSLGQWGVSWTARYSSKMKEGCTYLVPGSTEPNLECNEITYAPTGLYNPDGTPASSISRRRVVGSNTFHDLQVRWNAPWNATVAIGANNVFNHVGPVMYSQPSSNFSYNGAFDIGRFLYLKYTQKF